ncbi:hypothetical protein MMC12_002240 [Toensbergia leucococca]|nr:hypothetical protein [Toensbergia leucococca]
MNLTQFGLVSSIYTLGGLLGALSAGTCSTKFGRLVTMRLIAIFFILGPAFESLANSFAVISVGRFLSGLGAGGAIVVVPIYIAEVAPPKEKGLFGALTQVMVNLGIVAAQLLGNFLSKDQLWRIVLAVAGGLGLLQMVGLIFVPESPKWLAENRRPQRARRVLRSIRGQELNIDDEVKAWNIDSSAEDISEEESLLSAPAGSHPSPTPKAATSSIGILSALTQPTYRQATIAVVVVMFTQQFTGINSIVMYSVSLLSSLLPTTAGLITVAVSTLNLIMTILFAPLIDKVGRKRCLLLSIGGMFLSALLLAIGIGLSIKALSIIATLTFVSSFALGLGPVPYILSTELVGPEAIGATQSWALAANWIGTFVVAQFFPILNHTLGKGRVYYVFAALAILLGLFIAWYVPETKGKEGADEVWGRKVARRMEDNEADSRSD